MAVAETESIPGMALHISNLSTGEVGREDWEFKVSVGHVVSFHLRKMTNREIRQKKITKSQ